MDEQASPSTIPDKDPKPEPLPQSGGSYVRNADGTLTQTEYPTAPPGKVHDKSGKLVDAPKAHEAQKE